MDMLLSLPLDDLVAGITGTLAAIRSLLDSGSIQTMIGRLDEALLRFGRLADALGGQVKPLGEQLDRTLGQYETLGEQLGRILGQYATLAETLSARVNDLADGLESTTGDIGQLSRHLDAQVGPLAASAEAALRRADKTLATLEGAVAEGSDLRHQLGLLLREASGAARSLRDLADYLERHPEALFRGKR
jgi:paraquat-inducible protein B